MNEYYQAGGEVVAQKMFGNKGRISPAKEATLDTNGGLMYYEYDGLGTVTALRDRHGDIIEDYRYDAFGNLQTGITSPYNLKGYTGHLYDDKSSLVFMNARWYNPSVGRFMSEDTYRGDPATPQSLNQYAYVMNNPVNFVDPTGNIPLYSRDYLESKSRDYLVSLEAKMGEYWWEDYDEFMETGEWTEKQNVAHANAELIREVRPYIFEKIDHYESWSDWEFEGMDVHPERIVYTYSATKTITDVYQNDFETKADITYEHYTKTRVETAAEVAANNQSTIESDYGVVNSDWNNNPSIKLVRTERRTIRDYDNTLVNSTQTLTTDRSHTNVNKDVLIGEIGKGGVGADNSNAMKELFGIDDYEVPAGYKGVLYNNYKFANNVYDSAPIMMRLTPVLDTLIDGIELYNNNDFFTGKKLSTFDSHVNKLGLLLSVIGLDIVDDIQDAKRTIKGTVKGSDELVNVASDFRKNHILYGDKTGGGHLWPGAADKSVFPKSWDADTVMHNISDIATDPNIAWQKNRVVNGVQRYEVIGVRDGVKVKVITDGKDIITAFPID